MLILQRHNLLMRSALLWVPLIAAINVVGSALTAKSRVDIFFAATLAHFFTRSCFEKSYNERRRLF